MRYKMLKCWTELEINHPLTLTEDFFKQLFLSASDTPSKNYTVQKNYTHMKKGRAHLRIYF